MASDKNGVDSISSLLQKTEVRQQNVVSFKGKGLKLDNEKDAEDVIEAIRASPDLQVLELGGNTIGLDAAKAIANALKDRSELERCLWADIFTGRLRCEIPPSLMSLGQAITEAQAHLVEIDLSDNAFGPVGIESIADLLKSEASYTLQVLKFNNNGMGIGGKTLAELLINCHETSSACGKPLALKVFIAGRNRLEDPGAIALAKAFKTIGTLEEIHMPQNGINHEGITAMADAVKHSPNLKHINLNDNTFAIKGALSMANAIKEIDSLEIINFGDCLVRTEGASAIGEALRMSNPGLRTLILAFGEVQLEGAIRVCEALSSKEDLELVDLNGNQLGDDGVEEVFDMAKELGFSEALGSLSDDEGIESDADDDDDDEDDENNDDSLEEEEDPTSQQTTRMNGVHGHHEVGEVLASSVRSEDFPDNISAAALLVLDAHRLAELVNEAMLRLGKDPEACVDACAKIAGCLSTSRPADKTKLENAVYECANIYFRAAFEYSSDCPMQVINRILVKCGLIKSEEKSVKPVTNIRSLLQVLQHALAQTYFPDSTKKVVHAMVSKTCKVWENNYDIQGQLLQMLY